MHLLKCLFNMIFFLLQLYLILQVSDGRKNKDTFTAVFNVYMYRGKVCDTTSVVKSIYLFMLLKCVMRESKRWEGVKLSKFLSYINGKVTEWANLDHLAMLS